MKKAVVHIKNLSLRTIIGFNDWEREKKQDVIINAHFEFDNTAASHSDSVRDSINYKTVVKEIIHDVENSHYHLIEKLADHILGIIMRHERVQAATVEVDKPHSLRFAESVSVVVSDRR